MALKLYSLIAKRSHIYLFMFAGVIVFFFFFSRTKKVIVDKQNFDNSLIHQYLLAVANDFKRQLELSEGKNGKQNAYLAKFWVCDQRRGRRKRRTSN